MRRWAWLRPLAVLRLRRVRFLRWRVRFATPRRVRKICRCHALGITLRRRCTCLPRLPVAGVRRPCVAAVCVSPSLVSMYRPWCPSLATLWVARVSGRCRRRRWPWWPTPSRSRTPALVRLTLYRVGRRCRVLPVSPLRATWILRWILRRLMS